ncbi:MAG: PASTA domain-containing protein [Chitinophagaceae bacterium]
MFKAITSKPLWVNIVIGLLLAVVLVLGFFASLGWLTGHGKYEKVPSIVGQNVYAAIKTLEDKGFKVQVTDSVFTTTLPGLVITKQIPDGDAEVKQGRTIYLTINRAVPPLIEMPSLIGFSFKSAELYLQTLGLKLGDTTYRADYAKNAVLEQLRGNEPIKPGTKIPLGSIISFVLGSGVGSNEINVPDLVGLTLDQAKSLMSSLNLSIGSIVPVGNIADSSNAFVVRQNPEIFTEAVEGEKIVNKIRPGVTIDVYISATPPIKDTTNSHP